MSVHAIRCRCGALRGQLDCSGVSNRGICYCTDCRAFANFLGRHGEILDERGGTEIVQLAQPCLTFSQGTEHLAAVRLSEKGLIRWYAACCKTPIGNTAATPKVGFIGVIHSCLDRSHIDSDFGTSIALMHTASALGDGKLKQRGLFGMIVRILWILFITRISGRYKNSQLFDRSGVPKAQPRVLTREELMALKSAE
jgi:hypothetical protein